MKFTSFNPLIITSRCEDVVSLLEALGFEKSHAHALEEEGITNYTLKSPNGFKVDVSDVKSIPKDSTIIRMNVDNFEEAYEFLESRGFKAVSGKIVETKSSKSCMMVSPSGFDLCHHIKNHD